MVVFIDKMKYRDFFHIGNINVAGLPKTTSTLFIGNTKKTCNLVSPMELVSGSAKKTMSEKKCLQI